MAKNAAPTSNNLTAAVADQSAPLAVTDLRAIDADSSPIRWRACFRLTAPLPAGTETFAKPEPTFGPNWFGCFKADRIGAALELATTYNAYVALKGCGTIVATPTGQWFVNTSGNPGLATAGSGDVLTGFVTALLAQHWPPLEALLAAVHLHGGAADTLVAQGRGPIGLTAGELIDSARACFNRWIGERH